MKKYINIISYILSILFIIIAISGTTLYIIKQNNNDEKIKLPTKTEILTNYDIPVLEVNGDITNISKENKVDVTIQFHSSNLNLNSNSTIKWQGNSSLAYDKKNYNITLLDKNGDKNKIKIVESWGKQNKYCLKANFIDFSSARNVVSAKIYGEIVHSRNKDDKLNELVNGGAIDGFPIVMFINNKYQGLYTFNSPKDKWIFDMDKTGHQAILMADEWSDSTRLKEAISNDFVSSNWELEYCSTEESDEGTSWVVDSFNNLINFVNQSDDETFKNNITNYVDLDRTIDSMLYTLVSNARDNTAKNILWITYDGNTWIPSVYDLDGTWGLKWDGTLFNNSQHLTLEELKNNSNLLWQRIISNFNQEVKNRYFELRNEILSFENISQKFSNFISQIPTEIYNYETKIYPTIPNKTLSNLSQIIVFAQNHLKNLDLEFSSI